MSESTKGVSSMGEIFQLGHAAVAELFLDPVEITEKVDGSFISWTINKEGEILMRSKGQQLFDDAPSSKMFKAGMDAIRQRKDFLTPGWIYRGEYLSKPKHNSLAYERTPQGNIVLFDIEMAPGNHAGPLMRTSEAQRMGLTAVPVIYEGIADAQFAMSLLDRFSVLGGQKIEGVVVKSYSRFIHGKMMMAKYVSAEFKEKHATEWKQSNPGKKDVIENLIEIYKHPNRWRKAVQHLRDEGLLDGSPKDIGPLLKEVSSDVLKEEEAAIKEALWKYAWPQISRGVGRGLPEWYKDQLALGEVNIESLD